MPDPLMPLQAEVRQSAWGDAAGSVISPQNARKRPSAPLTRLMAIIVPGTRRLRMQGVYGATGGVVGIEWCGYNLIGPHKPSPRIPAPLSPCL